MPDIVQPLARWSDMIDGTYSIEDVKQMHAVMDELIHQHDRRRDARAN